MLKGRNAKKQLMRFETKRRVTQKAKAQARKMRYPTSWVRFDFGRKLSYYTGILTSLKKHVGTLRGKTGVHVASSFGIFTRFLQAQGVKAVAFDISEDATKIAKKIKTKKVVRGDANALPFKKESVDFFVSDHFLLSFNPEQLKGKNPLNDFSALINLYIALKPKGIAVIKYAMNPEKHMRVSGVAYYPAPEILREFLNALHFEILEVNKRSNIIVLRKK